MKEKMQVHRKQEDIKETYHSSLVSLIEILGFATVVATKI
jgi:hypothetical protein